MLASMLLRSSLDAVVKMGEAAVGEVAVEEVDDVGVVAVDFDVGKRVIGLPSLLWWSTCA